MVENNLHLFSSMLSNSYCLCVGHAARNRKTD